MSSNRKLFQPPSFYPPPPKNIPVPSTPPSGHSTSRFPWEEKQAKASRVFPDDLRPSSSESAPSVTTDTSTQAEPSSPTTPTVQITSSEPFATFSRTNAWDEMPEIGRYMASLPEYRRRAQLQVLLNKKNVDPAGSDAALSPSTEGPSSDPHQRRPSLRLTDFPTEIERPSLPVTPAPVRRPSFWGQERDKAGDLPAAEGVPDQSQWDPSAKLLELQTRQLALLYAGPSSPSRELPARSLPESSIPLPGVELKASPTKAAPSDTTPQVEQSKEVGSSSTLQSSTSEVEVTEAEPAKAPEPEPGKEPEGNLVESQHDQGSAVGI